MIEGDMSVSGQFDLPVEILPMAAWVMADRNATVAAVTLDDLQFTGSSKREPGDPHDPEIARMLAISRALDALSGALRTAAMACVTAATEERHRRSYRQFNRHIRRANQNHRVAEKAAAEGQVFAVVPVNVFPPAEESQEKPARRPSRRRARKES